MPDPTQQEPEELHFSAATIPLESDAAAYDAFMNDVIPAARECYEAYVTACYRTEQGNPVLVAPFQSEWIQNIARYPRLVMWAPIENGKCPCNSKIILASGEIKDAKDITPADRIWVLDPDTLEYRTARGTVSENGVKAYRRIRLFSGRTLEVTPNHPLRTVHGWTNAEDLKIGDALMGARHLPESTATDLTPDQAEVIGYWIGDGGLTGHSVQFTCKDPLRVERVTAVAERLGWRLSKHHDTTINKYHYGFIRGEGNKVFADGPAPFARQMGLLGCSSYTKRVPREVFRSSNAAVAAFIGAYFACDGHANPIHCGCLDISSVSRDLMLDVQLLLLRFGIVSRIRTHNNHYKGQPYTSYRLFITGREQIEAFRQRIPVHGKKQAQLQALVLSPQLASQGDVVPREWMDVHGGATPGELDRAGAFYKPRRGHHRTVVRRLLARKPHAQVALAASDACYWDRIESIEDRPPEMTWALEIHDPAQCYLDSGIVSHNSSHCSVWFPLWLLAHNPNLRIVVVSSTATQADRFGRAMRETIDSNPVFRTVFPHTRPGNLWTDSEFIVERPIVGMKDPSVKCIGVGGAILGARIDILILDDVLRFENVRTRAQRSKVSQWVRSTLLTRLTEDSRLIMIGTKWTMDDLYHELSRRPGFVSKTYRAIVDGKPLWPEKWSMKRLMEKRDELGQFEFARQLMNDLTTPETSRFEQPWFDLAKSRGGAFSTAFEYTPTHGEIVVCGVDLGASEKSTADLTVFHGIVGGHDGVRDFKRHLFMLSGRWTAPKIAEMIIRLFEKIPGIIFAVESNGAQSYLVQILEAARLGIPIIPFTTTRMKNHKTAGVERVAIDFATGKWIIPKIYHEPGQEAEVQGWIEDMMGYTPSIHLPDRLAASYFASTMIDDFTQSPRDLDDIPCLALITDQYAGIMVREPEDGRYILMTHRPCKPRAAYAWLDEQGSRPPMPDWFPPGLLLTGYPVTDEIIADYAKGARLHYDDSRIVVNDPIIRTQLAMVGGGLYWQRYPNNPAIRYMALASLARNLLEQEFVAAGNPLKRPRPVVTRTEPQQSVPVALTDAVPAPAGPGGTAQIVPRPAAVPMSWDILYSIGFPVLPPQDGPSDPFGL